MFLHDPVDPLVPIDDLKPRGKLRHCRGDDVADLIVLKAVEKLLHNFLIIHKLHLVNRFTNRGYPRLYD